MLHLPDNIKYIRELANKTQEDFAEMFDIKDKKGKISKDKVYTYESGRAKPPLHFLEGLAEFAGVTVAALQNVRLKKDSIHFKQEPDIVALNGNSLFIGEAKIKNTGAFPFDAGESIRKTEIMVEVLLSCVAELLADKHSSSASVLQKQLEAVVNARLNNKEP